MTLPERFMQFTGEKLPLKEGKRLLLAVSGGIDSVVLCSLCREANLSFSIAHCNFGLRGSESDRDEQFVQDLASKHQVECHVKKFDTAIFAEKNKLSIQEAARELRYSWFRELMKIENFECTLLAHQANDNIETVLMNFFRGTGLEGLTGIKEISSDGKWIRPMLSFSRKEIEAYAAEKKLTWMEDSSNSSSKYTRNFFRNELIPGIKKVFPQVEENLLDNIDRFRVINELYLGSVMGLKKDLIKMEGTEVRIPVIKLLKQYSPALVYEIIRDYGFGEKQIRAVEGLLHAGSGKFLESRTHQIIRHRAWLVIAPKAGAGGIRAIEKMETSIPFAGGELHLEEYPTDNKEFLSPSHVALIDAAKIEYPLILRKWKPGDYFYPLGMEKKKKLARFFIDQKLSRNRKENVWVLESASRIVWVVGYRIDHRFRIRPSTRSVLKITYQGEVVGV